MLIVQMFNQPFAKVERQLPRLQRLGFSHILVSPPQKSHASRSWWGRYQPVDFRRVEGPLGDQYQLESLCRAAARLGLSIVADTVLAHMSNERRRFEWFGPQDFVNYPARRGLLRLRPESPWVRSQLRDYVHMLYHLGVRGYRFDAAKHVPPDLFEHVLDGLPPVLCFGELVLAHPRDFPERYWRTMKAYDFPLARSLRQAFVPGGDLGSLVRPQALWGPHSVTFVSHHDMTMNRSKFAFFRIDDVRDRQLAYVYVLGRRDGLPLVYAPDLKWAEARAGAKFHRACLGQDQEWLQASHTTLAWRRGRRALAVLNKGGEAWRPDPLPTGLEPGQYRDFLSKAMTWVDEAGRWHGGLGPRSAGLLVKA